MNRRQFLSLVGIGVTTTAVTIPISNNVESKPVPTASHNCNLGKVSISVRNNEITYYSDGTIVNI